MTIIIGALKINVTAKNRYFQWCNLTVDGMIEEKSFQITQQMYDHCCQWYRTTPKITLGPSAS